MGNPKWVNGKVGSALQFSGEENSNYVEVPDHPSLNPNSEVTCAAWIYFDEFQPTGGIISKYIGAGNQRSYNLHATHDIALALTSGCSSNGAFQVGTSTTTALREPTPQLPTPGSSKLTRRSAARGGSLMPHRPIDLPRSTSDLLCAGSWSSLSSRPSSWWIVSPNGKLPPLCRPGSSGTTGTERSATSSSPRVLCFGDRGRSCRQPSVHVTNAEPRRAGSRSKRRGHFGTHLSRFRPSNR